MAAVEVIPVSFVLVFLPKSDANIVKQFFLWETKSPKLFEGKTNQIM